MDSKLLGSYLKDRRAKLCALFNFSTVENYPGSGNIFFIGQKLAPRAKKEIAMSMQNSKVNSPSRADAFRAVMLDGAKVMMSPELRAPEFTNETSGPVKPAVISTTLRTA